MSAPPVTMPDPARKYTDCELLACCLLSAFVSALVVAFLA